MTVKHPAPSNAVTAAEKELTRTAGRVPLKFEEVNCASINLTQAMQALRAIINTGDQLQDEELHLAFSAWIATGKALEIVETKLRQLRLEVV